MSLAIVHSRALVGLHAPEVRVEVHLANGLPALHIVGLPQAAVRESAHRVRAALQHGGFDFPSRRITVNLAPADLPKDSGRFDLPIAIGILIASQQLPAVAAEDLEFVGELSLTGELRPIRGALAMAIARDPIAARRLVLPTSSQPEVSLLPVPGCLIAKSLLQVCAHLRAVEPLDSVAHRAPPSTKALGTDLADIRGQALAKRALQVAAAGGHSLLMIGPPGSGKTLLAGALASLLPPPDEAAAIECARIASVAGRFEPAQWGRRPLRAPHHSASLAALTGGGNPPRPGEITLAHHGLLFLDELPEFSRPALECLREPLETGAITVSRAGRQATFPAAFQLVAAMNPCPCGHLGSPLRRCTCPPGAAERYLQRLSGPLIDRIDLRIDVFPVSAHELLAESQGPEVPSPATSAQAAASVLAARERSLARQGCANAALDPAGIERHCPTDAAGRALLAQAARRFRWSARAVHRTLKLARSVADLEGHGAIGAEHIGEAIHYRGARLLNEATEAPVRGSEPLAADAPGQ